MSDTAAHAALPSPPTRSAGVEAASAAVWRSLATSLAREPFFVLWTVCFAAVVLAHLTLLTLPYFWDEGGYYVPAALDFFHRWTLIPEFTNAHPPLPNVVLGLAWHVFGFHIVVTRLVACAFAAAGLAAVLRLSLRLLGSAAAALAVTVLTAIYPIWFAQSSLAQADIFAAAFTLAAFAVYLPLVDRALAPARRLWLVALLFSLSVMAKETAIVQPATLAGIALWQAVRTPSDRRRWLARLLALSTPLPVLVLWYVYHHHQTGFTFGNPEYLRYNATANMNAAHVWQAVRYRFLHLFWQRNMWLPLVIAGAAVLLRPAKPATAAEAREQPLPRQATLHILLLIAANWAAFSVLGGALLTRYLLPMYPLLLLLAVATWRRHMTRWGWAAVVTGVAFSTAIWWNPPTSFAPEDNLTYRDMIVVHQQAIAWLGAHYPDATVLTAWPGAAELWKPELGYTQHRFKVTSIENFSPGEIARAATEPDRYDTAFVFTTHYTAPLFQHWLLTHPDSRRGREFAATRDMTPREIARLLGGTVEWYADRGGEWAAILRFPRRYDASVR